MFGNRTQLHPIKLNFWIEFNWIQQSDQIKNQTVRVWFNPNQSNISKQNRTKSIRLHFSSHTQSNTIKWIASNCSVNKFAWTKIMLCALKNMKNMCYTEKKLKPQKTCYWFSTPVLQKKSRVQKSKVQFSSIVQSFLCEFDLVRLSNSVVLNQWIEFDWVRLKDISARFQDYIEVKSFITLCDLWHLVTWTTRSGLWHFNRELHHPVFLSVVAEYMLFSFF